MGRKKKEKVRGLWQVLKEIPVDPEFNEVEPKEDRIKMLALDIDDRFKEFTAAVNLYKFRVEGNLIVSAPGDFLKIINLRNDIEDCSNAVAESIALLIEEKRK